MKRQSIRTKLMKLAVVLLVIFMIFQVVLVLCFNFLFKNVKNTVNKQNLYTTYEATATLLDESVTNYFDDPTYETLSILNQNTELFSDLSEQIYAFFQSSQFEDTYILSASYTEAIEELIDSVQSQNEDASFLLYKECSHLYHLIIKQYGTTLSFEMAVLSDKLNLVFTNENIFNLIMLSLICMVFFIILICCSNTIQKILEPLFVLARQAKEFEEGNYHDKADNLLLETNYSEIHTLSCAFLHMENTIREQIVALKDKITLSQKLHDLELENMSAQMALSQTENSLMQSLINPHFLFNCLNLIASFAIIEKAPTVHEYSIQIAQYLRESLNYVGKYITLQKEFSFLEHYTGIQKLRFGTRISFSLQCSEDCQNAMIPAMILQPLVENALVHGVGSYLKDGEVYISAQKWKEKKILITIRDNGNGIPPQKQKEIMEMLHTPFRPGQKGTGIRSVLCRLNYCYDKDVLFDIDSQSTATTISLIIPYRTLNSQAVIVSKREGLSPLADGD